jgi:DNA-binding response OmpR family regulator
MTNSETAISVLVASPFAEDLEAFRLAFRAFGLDWRLIAAPDCGEAWRVLHRDNVDVVVVEAEFPDGIAWRDLIHEIAEMHGCQAVIVASRLADDRLWAEVLNLGGYDLLAKPFDRDELVRVIAMAARYSAQKGARSEQRPERALAASGAVA